MMKEISELINEIQNTIEMMQESRKIIRKRVVKWTTHKDFSIEFDEDGFSGSWQYRVYYRIDRKEIDCCSLTAASEQQNRESLIEFVRMCEGMNIVD